METLRCFFQLLVATLGAGIAFLIGNHTKTVTKTPPILSIGNVHIALPIEAEPDAEALASVLSMHTEQQMYPIVWDSDEWNAIANGLVAIIKWRKVMFKNEAEAAKVLSCFVQNVYCAGYARASKEKELSL